MCGVHEIRRNKDIDRPKVQTAGRYVGSPSGTHGPKTYSEKSFITNMHVDIPWTAVHTHKPNEIRFSPRIHTVVLFPLLVKQNENRSINRRTTFFPRVYYTHTHASIVHCTVRQYNSCTRYNILYTRQSEYENINYIYIYYIYV